MKWNNWETQTLDDKNFSNLLTGQKTRRLIKEAEIFRISNGSVFGMGMKGQPAAEEDKNPDRLLSFGGSAPTWIRLQSLLKWHQEQTDGRRWRRSESEERDGICPSSEALIPASRASLAGL